MLDILLDAAIDSVKLIPFLFITYLIMEYLEHKMSEKSREQIGKAGKFGPVIGGLLGAVPQCGFSVSATNLYVGRVISLGTLIAVYLSTSDEMIPVFLSEAVPVSVIFKIVGIKVAIGMFAGIIIDIIFQKKETENKIHTMCEHDHCHCEDGIVKSSINHTINITIFIFIISVILNGLIEWIGEEAISNLIKNQAILGPLVAGFIGLIPNCASSVMIAELYIDGIISSGTMLAGLLVGAGVGLLVLFRENSEFKENIKIISILYAIGVVCRNFIRDYRICLIVKRGC